MWLHEVKHFEVRADILGKKQVAGSMAALVTVQHRGEQPCLMEAIHS
jgi:hypothetical protein